MTRVPRSSADTVNLARRRFAASLVLALGAAATLSDLAAAQTQSSGAREITWDDLWPEGEDARLEELFNSYLAATGRDDVSAVFEGSAADKMPQIGTFNTVANLNGKKVRIPGYVVPFDFNSKNKHASFLLVPYFGACIHTPPPPPNQIINVTANPAVTIKDIWSPIWAEGVLSTERTDSKLADAAYGMALTKIEPYGR